MGWWCCPNLPRWVVQGARGNWLDRSPPVWVSSLCPALPSSEARSPPCLPVTGWSWPLSAGQPQRGDRRLQPGLAHLQPHLWSPSVAFSSPLVGVPES